MPLCVNSMLNQVRATKLARAESKDVPELIEKGLELSLLVQREIGISEVNWY